MTDFHRLKSLLDSCTEPEFLNRVFRAGNRGRVLPNRFAQHAEYDRCIICLEGSRWHAFYQGRDLIEVKLGPGDAIVIPAGCWINTWYTEDNRSLSMILGDGTLRMLHLIGRLEPGERRYLRGIPKPEVSFPFALGPAEMSLMRLASDTDINGPEWYTRNVLQCFLYRLSTSLPGHQPADSRKSDITWRRVASYIVEHCQGDINRSVAAREIGLHENHLSHLFTVRGTTFTHFLNASRIERACELLTDTTATSAEVGYLCGFQSAGYFGRVFKAHKGVTPLQYRDGKT